MIFNQIQNDELAYSQHIEELIEKQAPEFLFCFDFDQSLIDRDQPLTGDYLQNVTSHMTAETVFRRISYLNDRSEWKELNRSKEDRTSNQTNNPANDRTNNQINKLDQTNDLRMDTVFFYDKKCFRIRNPIRYELRQFIFDDLENLVYYPILKVDFNEQFTTEKAVIFFTKTPDKMLLSEPIYLNWLTSNVSYSIKQTPRDLINRDKFFSFLKFDLLRSPLSLFHDSDVHSYLTNLKSVFRRRYKATTLQLPLEENEFGLPINDTLFRQHYDEVQHPRDKSTPNNLIFERQIFKNRYFLSKDSNDSHLVFMMNFHEEKQEFRNGDNNNLAKFILNNLNAFSLWLSINLFSMFAFKFDLFSGRSIRKTIRKFFSPSRVASDETIGEAIGEKIENAKTGHSPRARIKNLSTRIERSKWRSESDIWTSSKAVDEALLDVDDRRLSEMAGKGVSQGISQLDDKRSRFRRRRIDFNQTVEF